MSIIIALSFILAGQPDETSPEAVRVLNLINTKYSTPKSFAFVYEGTMRWVGNPSLTDRPDSFAEDFQGTFLYRNDGAALYDLYDKNPTGFAGVIRKKATILHGRFESSQALLDSKQKVGPDQFRSGSGTILSLNKMESPHNLLLNFDLNGLLKNIIHHISSDSRISSDGWEEVDGSKCLRIKAELGVDSQGKIRSSQVYWIDLERNANVLKLEYFESSKLVARVDQIKLVELAQGDGSRYWLPVHARNQNFTLGEIFSRDPLYEHLTSIVDGSLQINIDLPDSLFSVRGDTALPLPSELDRVEKASKAGALRSTFDAQPVEPIPPTPRTDAASVRKRIDENLFEANRQSKELEASSAARATWSWSGVLQWSFATLGVTLLASGTIWKWRAR